MSNFIIKGVKIENKFAKIIVLVNQKGGCGKTTLAMNLGAGIAVLAKKKILIVDGDIQGTATKWVSNAEEEKPYPGTICGSANCAKNAHKEIKKYLKDYDYIIVDCPPAVDNPFTDSVLMVADLALIPIIPSPADFYASVGIVKVINQIAAMREKNNEQDILQFRIIENIVKPNMIMSKEVIKAMQDSDTIKLNTDIGDRTVYKQTILPGGSVFDFNDVKAKAEISALTKEILSIV